MNDNIKKILNDIESKRKDKNVKLNLNTIYEIKSIEYKVFISKMFSMSFRGESESISLMLCTFSKTDLEVLEKGERKKVYLEFSNLIRENIHKRDVFEQLFYTPAATPYWNRLDNLFENKKKELIGEEKYKLIIEKFQDLILRTIRIALNLEEKEEDAWIENFKTAIKIHEISPSTRIFLEVKMEENKLKGYRGDLETQIKIQELYKNWYQRNNHTFLAENREQYGIKSYLNNLLPYRYLLDENNKKVIESELLKFKIEEENEENLRWIIKQIKKIFIN
jgi:hypothetical protein